MFFLRRMALLLLLLHVSLHAEMLHARFGYILSDVTPLAKHNIRLGYEYVVSRYAKSYDANISIIFDASPEKLSEMFINGELEYLGMIAHKFVQLLPKIEHRIGKILLSSADPQLLERYVILTNKADITSFDAFENSALVLYENDINAIIYADTKCLTHYQKRYDDFFRLHTSKSYHQSILDLYFDKAEVTLVPYRSYKTAIMMNPAIKKKVFVYEISEPVFANGVELYANTLTPIMLEMTRRSDADLFTTEEGKQLRRIMKIANRKEVTLQEAKEMLGYYSDYYAVLKSLGKGAK